MLTQILKDKPDQLQHVTGLTTGMENKLEYEVGKKKTPTFTAQEIRVLKRNNHKKRNDSAELQQEKNTPQHQHHTALS